MLKVSDLENILKRIHEWTWRVDTKVQILIALEALAFGFLLPHVTGRMKDASELSTTLAVVGVGMLVVSLVKNLQALFPRLHGLDWRTVLRSLVGKNSSVALPTSVTFFDHIAQMTLSDYRNRVNGMESDSADYREEFISQIHICAVIVSRKFHDFRLSALVFAIGVGFIAASHLV